MGTARWNPDDWDTYVAKTATTPTSAIFSRTFHKDLDPLYIKVRESCDSEINPCSTPIIVAVDDTGSMGYLAEHLIRKGLGVLIEEIYLRKPVSDPHVMCMAVGDAWCDAAPLQVTQFEADIRLVDQLSRFLIEGGGGANAYESYNLPWYFAAKKTRCDSILKRNKKGYLFTVGDEPPPPHLLKEHIKRIFGDTVQADMKSRELLDLVSKSFHVFHIIISEGSYCAGGGLSRVKREWNALLGQRAIPLSNHKNLSELIVSTIQVNEGEDLAKVAGSWQGSTALVVRDSLKCLVRIPLASGKGVTRL